ncbi:MAG TPA: PAC2 family protein [Egibacteraceae bacterium]|nr:PAC2 family protein [Egibacteraceae bacterium]
MQTVTIHQQPARLRRPVLIAAFCGWNDAGEAASAAVRALREELDASLFAEIDAEDFIDFQQTRPMVRIVDGRRRIDWPRNRFWRAELPGIDRDVIILEGTEPNLRWQAFCAEVVGLARSVGVDEVVTLGALQVDVPHTQAVPVTGSADSDEVAQRLGLRASSYEGPTGITGVLSLACAEVGMSSISMWAGVPHYLAGTSYLVAALALADRVVGLLGADLSLDRLAQDAAKQRDDIADLVQRDEDLAEYVEELEQRGASVASERDSQMADRDDVTGDELAAEFERYLRERGS